MVVRVFFFVSQRKQREFSGSKPKIRTLFFCGSAVRHYMPSSGRKVARVSVTEGARETEKRRRTENCRKTQVAHSPSVAPRQLPPGGSLCLCVFFSLCHRENKGNFQAQNPKSAHFSSAAAQCVAMSLSGRKVSRESVTEGACETENRHILLFFAPQFVPAKAALF